MMLLPLLLLLLSVILSLLLLAPGSHYFSCIRTATASFRQHQQQEKSEDDHDRGVHSVYQLIDRFLPNSTARQNIQLTLLHSLSSTQHHDSTSSFLTVQQHRQLEVWYDRQALGTRRRNPTNSSKDERRFFALGDSPRDQSSRRRIHIVATSLSDLTAGVGWYFRHYCNMTIGWPRGGGSHRTYFDHGQWPTIGNIQNVSSWRIYPRHVPWSYFMNVCTHSYSLVWYDWSDGWEPYIDWLALSGINLIPALTGQEEIQYHVFRQLGVSDEDIRHWFNGPAFLTWSRGQNEYGNNIAGPLPRSWMKGQWEMQKNHILPRLRSLGIVGQLPGFQGNVPIQLKSILPDSNMTEAGATGWMDALDPWYGKIADLWMEKLVGDFGTDHWYQLDGYFNGGTAPWRSGASPSGTGRAEEDIDPKHDRTWYQRGQAVYSGLTRTDPDAVWSYQGFAFVGWDTPQQAQYLRGFVDSVPKGKFVVLDMGYVEAEWTKWNNASFFGAPFIWTMLHNFGGTNGIKGNIARVSRDVPTAAIEAGSSIIGLGGTPEGIDQNPLYYEFLFDQPFRQQPAYNISSYLARRSQVRYGLGNTDADPDILKAWTLLSTTAYSTESSVQDTTGVAHWSPNPASSWFDPSDRVTPSSRMCKMVQAWELLLSVASQKYDHTSSPLPAPLSYDLVNVGREVLAQLSVPVAVDFTDAVYAPVLNRSNIQRTGERYYDLLMDLDSLVDTDSAFHLTLWVDSARKWGEGNFDCEFRTRTGAEDDGAARSSFRTNCSLFYEWNAKCQITTWNPTFQHAVKIPDGPVDYAAKHWSGLIYYYAQRVTIVHQQALVDQAKGNCLNETELSRRLAAHAFNWTTQVSVPVPNEVPTKSPPPPGVVVAVSKQMLQKYSSTPYFTSCSRNQIMYPEA